MCSAAASDLGCDPACPLAARRAGRRRDRPSGLRVVRSGLAARPGARRTDQRLPPELTASASRISRTSTSDRPSRGGVACRRAVDWVARRERELVCVTRNLVSHPRGEAVLRDLLARLDRPYVVLGNHDVALTRDPFSAAAELHDLARPPSCWRTRPPWSRCAAGASSWSVWIRSLAPPRGAGRLCVEERRPARALCHFPAVWRTLPDGAFHLVLAGHLHAGQLRPALPRRAAALARERVRVAAASTAAATRCCTCLPGSARRSSRFASAPGLR